VTAAAWVVLAHNLALHQTKWLAPLQQQMQVQLQTRPHSSSSKQQLTGQAAHQQQQYKPPPAQQQLLLPLLPMGACLPAMCLMLCTLSAATMSTW
jgi:hypothetical protein